MKINLKTISRNSLLWIIIALLTVVLIVLRTSLQSSSIPVAQNLLMTQQPLHTPTPDQTGTVEQIYFNANLTLTAIFSSATQQAANTTITPQELSQGNTSTSIAPLVEEVQSAPTSTQAQPPTTFQATSTQSAPIPTSSQNESSPPANVTPTISQTLPPPTETYLPYPTATNPGCDFTTDDSFEITLLVFINGFRTSQGMRELQFDETLNTVAQNHSQDMTCRDFYDHIGSDGSTFLQRLQGANFSFSKATELLYVGRGEQNDPQKAFEAWLNGPSSTAQLLYPAYTHVGIGYVYRESSTYGGYLTLVMTAPSIE